MSVVHYIRRQQHLQRPAQPATVRSRLRFEDRAHPLDAADGATTPDVFGCVPGDVSCGDAPDPTSTSARPGLATLSERTAADCRRTKSGVVYALDPDKKGTGVALPRGRRQRSRRLVGHRRRPTAHALIAGSAARRRAACMPSTSRAARRWFTPPGTGCAESRSRACSSARSSRRSLQSPAWCSRHRMTARCAIRPRTAR